MADRKKASGPRKTTRKKGAGSGAGASGKATHAGHTGHPTTREKLIDLFKANPEKEYSFAELAHTFKDVSEKTISSILTDLRDNRAYELIFQPRHGYWKFRDRRNGLMGGAREEDQYRFKHFAHIFSRMQAHPDIFSEFDLEGYESLLRDNFAPALVDQLRPRS